MKKTLAILLAVAMTFALLAACTPAETTASPSTSPTESGAASPSASAAPSEPAASADATPDPNAKQTFTDSADRTVELPATITKIAPGGALAQMFLVAIAPDLMVSVASAYSDDSTKYVPANLLALPEVGQFYGSDDLNFETIAAINPDVVIDLGEPKKTIKEDMDSITSKLAIPAVHITAYLRPDDSRPGVSSADAFRTLGKLLGREQRGEELAQYVEKVLAAADARLANSGGVKPKVLYLVGDSGLNVIAKTSFHAEIVDYLADNVAVVDEPSGRGSGNETDLEQILLWNPEFIVFGPNSVYSTVKTDPTWSQLDAIKNDNYAEIPIGPYNWMGMPPSVNRYFGMVWLSELLYPDAAGDRGYELIREGYRLFLGYDLTIDEWNAFVSKTPFAVS
ncbi:MAG: ABC transporter substrate-binding protein [Oscillospiraceae bacterium]|jgi:iron complex transport system substrate-binding protein|nr:ABC transporter substrate-binding protein [Oscillospiraceae bacterium]